MYQEFYGFKEKPFALTPDPQFFYQSETHWTAIKSLLYGIQRRMGFMVVTGDIGTGKTTLCRVLLEKLGKEVKTAVIFNSFLNYLKSHWGSNRRSALDMCRLIPAGIFPLHGTPS